MNRNWSSNTQPVILEFHHDKETFTIATNEKDSCTYKFNNVKVSLEQYSEKKNSSGDSSTNPYECLYITVENPYTKDSEPHNYELQNQYLHTKEGTRHANTIRLFGTRSKHGTDNRNVLEIILAQFEAQSFAMNKFPVEKWTYNPPHTENSGQTQTQTTVNDAHIRFNTISKHTSHFVAITSPSKLDVIPHNGVYFDASDIQYTDSENQITINTTRPKSDPYDDTDTDSDNDGTFILKFENEVYTKVKEYLEQLAKTGSLQRTNSVQGTTTTTPHIASRPTSLLVGTSSNDLLSMLMELKNKLHMRKAFVVLQAGGTQKRVRNRNRNRNHTTVHGTHQRNTCRTMTKKRKHHIECSGSRTHTRNKTSRAMRTMRLDRSRQPHMTTTHKRHKNNQHDGGTRTNITTRRDKNTDRKTTRTHIKELQKHMKTWTNDIVLLEIKRS